MTEVRHKTCKQCGQIKMEDEFRPYYHKTKHGNANTRYRVCKGCESINTRFKYLNQKLNKSTIKPNEEQELSKINELFDLLESRGLTPPKRKTEEQPLLTSVLELISIHQVEAAKAVELTGAADTPIELTEWLTIPLAGDPDDLRDKFDALERTYRPQIGVDNKTFKPIFDDTYKDILIKIENAIDMYEDNYYADIE